jgi:hypothetical protein
MKRFILCSFYCICAATALNAQINITASDMPVVGDTLRYSGSLPTVSLNLSNTGANIAWDYSTLTPTYQAVDTYKLAAAAGYSGGGIPPTAYGYKVADTLRFTGAPAYATNVYTFFNIKSGPSRYVAEGFGAKLGGLPVPVTVPAGYSDEDEWYFFPLTYNTANPAYYDSTSFRLTATIPLVGSLMIKGTRKTSVDGWGTIKTPYYTTAIQTIRVRSEVNEVDSVTVGTTVIGVPRHYVDYKWLVNGQHYPALWVTTTVVGTTETPSSVTYRDSKRALGVSGPSAITEALQVYPNPAYAAEVTVKVPAAWNHYTLRLYDAVGKIISETNNSNKLSTAQLPAGKYIILAESNGVYGAAQFVK